jgi:hypothetical protein
VLESLPASAVMLLPDNSIKVSYNLQAVGDKILVIYKREIEKILFLPEEYKALQELYNQIVKKHSESVILKKII